MLRERWHDLIDQVARKSNAHSRNCLLDAEPVVVTEQLVTIAFDPEFASEKDEMDVPANKRALMHVLCEMLGRQVNVALQVLASKEKLPSDIPMGRTAANDEVGEKVKKSGRSGMNMVAKAQWMENPSVRMTLEAFNGDIVDIRV